MKGLANALLAGVLGVGALLVAFSTPALADRDRHEEHHWYHGPIHEFHDRDLHAWRGGHWYHGRHGGRDGWWWIVGGVYYWYPARVYPYPDPFIPPAARLAPVPPAPPPPIAQSVPGDAPRVWYYCDAAGDYYPYVPSCPSGWRIVPADPSRAPHP